MATINIDKMSLKDINDLEAKLAKAKANARDKAKADIQQAVADLLDLLKTYAGGAYESAILTAANPAI